MTPERRFQVDRAVWLYQRWGRALDHGQRTRAVALGHRLTRWLAGADATQRAAYYQGICALDQTETTHARVARRRGRRLKQLVEQSREYDAQFEDGPDDAR